MKQDTLSRRNFLSAAGASLAAGTPAGAAPLPVPATGSRPNLILFMPDELRADALSCYGNTVCRTPNLDHLAGAGVRFTNCHVQYPVCGASRCSLLTGWPTSVRGHRSLYYFLRPEEPNLFRYLKQNNYDVFWYGKNDALASESFAGSVTEWNYYPWETAGDGRAAMGGMRPPYAMSDPLYHSFLYPAGGDRRHTADYHNLTAATHILERTQTERPFCIFLPLSSPHPPYAGPKDFHDLYDPARLPPLRPIGLPGKPNFHAAIRKAYNIESLPESAFRKIRAVYLGMVSYTDWLLGELLEALDKSSHASNTAVFVFSDHGDWAGDYGLVEKWPSALDNTLTHVPLIARVPGGAAGHAGNAMVELYDVMATCLDLAGIEAQHTHFARSLLPQLHGQPGDADRAAFAEGGYNIYEPQCFEPPRPPEEIYGPKSQLQVHHPETITRCAMVQTRDYKLVLRPGGQSELYDSRQDPQELHNLYGEPGAAAIRHRLIQRLAVWYLTTTGVAPFDKDPRAAPAFAPTPHFADPHWQRDLLDQT